MNPVLEIPPGQRAALTRLIGLSSAGRKQLLKALKEAEPSLLHTRMTVSLAPKLDMSEGETRDILTMLASLYVSMDIAGEPVESFTRTVMEAIKPSMGPDLKLKDAEWAQFQEYLAEVLSLDETLGISAKATDIRSEYDRTFCTARILTDLRPVFGRDVSKGPPVAVIIHAAKITFHESGEDATKDFFVALDSTDIRDLRRLLERATNKEESLKAVARQGGINVLEA